MKSLFKKGDRVELKSDNFPANIGEIGTVAHVYTDGSIIVHWDNEDKALPPSVFDFQLHGLSSKPEHFAIDAESGETFEIPMATRTSKPLSLYGIGSDLLHSETKGWLRNWSIVICLVAASFVGFKAFKEVAFASNNLVEVVRGGK